MISRSDWEPLPTPTLSPFARGYLSLCRFFTAAVWCVPALRVPLVHSLINHFRQKSRREPPGRTAFTATCMACRLLVAGLSSSTRSAFCREASLLARRPTSRLHQVPLQASIRSTALGLDGQKQLFGTQAAGALSCPGPRGCGAEQARKLFGTVVGGGARGLLRARGALTSCAGRLPHRSLRHQRAPPRYRGWSRHLGRRAVSAPAQGAARPA